MKFNNNSNNNNFIFEIICVQFGTILGATKLLDYLKPFDRYIICNQATSFNWPLTGFNRPPFDGLNIF